MLHVDLEPQLMVDNWIIGCSQAVTRRWHKPTRHPAAPLVKKDRPWEQMLYFTYSNYRVLRDPEDGLIKCWYEDLGPTDGRGHPMQNRVLYAVSHDGLTFEKPELDVCPIGGKRTNIVMGIAEDGKVTESNPFGACGVHSNSFLIDPHASNDDERYRTIFTRCVRNKAVSQFDMKGWSHETDCAHSPDGIHWTPYGERPRIGATGKRLGDVSCLAYDDNARVFLQYTRHGKMAAAALPPETPKLQGWFGPYHPFRADLTNKRRIYHSFSSDFLHWSEPILVQTLDDRHDSPDEGHYGMNIFRAGRHVFGTLGIFRYVDDEMDVRLMISRDGLHFESADRGRPFLQPRGDGSWDAHMVSMTSPPVEMGDEWWFYHGGTDSHHDWWITGLEEELDVPEARDMYDHVHFGLGLAVLRKEGIAGMAASGVRPGYLITRPLMSQGTRLVINGRCNTGGWIRAAVLDQHLEALGNCRLDHCDRFTGDATEHTVTWKKNPELPAPGTWRAIRFDLQDAEIFSFRFA